MPRGLPTDQRLYQEAKQRVLHGARHRLIKDSIDHAALTATCEICGPGSKVYATTKFYTCANYYVDNAVRKRMIALGERVPELKRGRIPKGQIQHSEPVPITDEYLPWRDRATPPDGFDPAKYDFEHNPFGAADAVVDYIDAQAQAQGMRCFCCGFELRKVVTGPGRVAREYGFAALRNSDYKVKPVFMDEVFCNPCKTNLEQMAPFNLAQLVRYTEVLAGARGITHKGPLPGTLADPTIQRAILDAHGFHRPDDTEE